MRRIAVRVALALTLVVGLCAVAFAKEPAVPPAPALFVTDNAHLLDSGTVDSLEARLQKYQDSSGHQVIVWIGTTIGDEIFDEWAAQAFKVWKVGRAKLDDGVAIFILTTDHKVRIEVGFGLEDKLTDAYASRIINDVIVPAMKTGTPDAVATGLNTAVDQVIAYISAPQAVAGQTQQDPVRHGGGSNTAEMVLIAIIGLVVLGFGVTHPRMALWLLWNILSSIGSGGGGGGWSGGGGGGGGFSGGGGRSGGGGASGSW